MIIYTNHKINLEVDHSLKDLTCVLATTKKLDEKTNQEKVYLVREDFYKPEKILNESSRFKFGIRNLFKRIFCKHKCIVLANSHGDLINALNKRTYVICVNCGKGFWIEDYIEAPYGYSYSGFRKKENQHD